MSEVTASSDEEIEIVALERIEIALRQWAWPFAAGRRPDIGRHFADIQRRRADVWNGRVLLLNRYEIDGGSFRGACFETDYASLCAWRDWNFPDPAVYNFFAAAALRSSDGAFLMGEMAAATANAGMLYFPCGTPEPADVGTAGAIDMMANLARELLEETGIELEGLGVDPGWTMVRQRCYVALMKLVTTPWSADELRTRALHHIASEERPEFNDVRLVRSPADFHPAMPAFATAFLTHLWSG